MPECSCLKPPACLFATSFTVVPKYGLHGTRFDFKLLNNIYETW
jgi:hypothetical protein